MSNSKAFLCAFFSGIFLSIAFPPAGLGFLAYAAIIPMFFIFVSLRPRKVMLWAWFSGIIFLGTSLFWIALHQDIIWPVMVLAVVFLAFFYALPYVLASLLSELSHLAGLLVFPFAVAGTEWLRSFDQLAFPWMILGNSQTPYPWLIQFADITSAYGVSWWVAMVNVSLYLLIKRRTAIRWGLLIVLFAAPVLYSRVVMHRSTDSGKEITIALIQGNVTPEEKWADGMKEWNINLYRSMSIESMAYDPDLIIWPETATPVYLADIVTYRRMVQSLVDSIGVPVLTGMPSIDFKTGETWNSAGLFIPGKKKVERYHKLHLVPFGEAIPFDNIFPTLRSLKLGQANWNEGTESVVFKPPGLPPFNVLICFESIFPDLVRKFIIKGSQMIVVITNDVWFGPYASPIQHAMISVMRAIEFHRPVVRCANTGITMIIDSFGRIKDRTETFERTKLVGTVIPGDTKTFYHRFGNIFSIFSFVVSLVSLIVYFSMKKLSVLGGKRPKD